MFGIMACNTKPSKEEKTVKKDTSKLSQKAILTKEDREVVDYERNQTSDGTFSTKIQSDGLEIYKAKNAQIIQTDSGISFRVCTIDTTRKLQQEFSYVKAIEKALNKRIEGYSRIDAKTKKLVPASSLVASMQIAYVNHHPFVISPDMIWLTLCQGFSKHINTNPNKYRKFLVAHQGKKRLDIVPKDFKKGKQNPWEEAIVQWQDSIKKYVKEDAYGLIVDSFSTTDLNATIAYQVTLMETMQEYFNYGMYGCGIPYITLEGKTEDWVKIRNKIEGFRKYDLNEWVDNLIPILDQFVEASKGNIDVDFWQNMFKNNVRRYGPKLINGWILKLYPYLEDRKNNSGIRGQKKYIRNAFLKGNAYHNSNLVLKDFPSGLSSFDFVWIDPRINLRANMEFGAGFIGMTQNKQTKALKPEIGWYVLDKNSPYIETTQTP
ncbi:hypothetical protein AD998_15030 [bacterium 336/3]|nr:hypothetical protein AD998_15030 [bacterium 336/3]